MYIRKANITDLEDLIVLYNQLIPYQKLVINKSIIDTFKLITDYPNYNILVAEENKKAIATCSIIILPNLTHYQRPYAILENIVTDKKFRGQGYATALLNFAKKIANEKQCHKILVQTRSKSDDTLKFYLNNGFRNDETIGFQINIEVNEKNG